MSEAGAFIAGVSAGVIVGAAGCFLLYALFMIRAERHIAKQRARMLHPSGKDAGGHVQVEQPWPFDLPV